MLGVLILVAFIKLNTIFEKPSIVALGYTIVGCLIELMADGLSLELGISAIVMFLFTWLFFWLLRLYSDSIMYFVIIAIYISLLFVAPMFV